MKRLLIEAQRLFPTDGRCVRCGFRRPYHEPANHAYEPPEHPFVRALREFIEDA